MPRTPTHLTDWRNLPGESPLLARAARWAEARPELMGSVLARYRLAHGLGDAALGDDLACSLNAVHVLALCRRPDPASAEAIDGLAGYTGCDPGRLAALLAADA